MTDLALLPTTDAVPAEVVSFLAQFAVALHKQRAYPPGHPMRAAAARQAFEALDPLLEDRTALRLGVARHQLVIEDQVTDPDHFIIRDLAERLHRRQIGSIVLRPGITADELASFLDVLIQGGLRGRQEPLRPEEVTAEHVEVTAIAFDALALRDLGDIGVQIDRLWQELAVTVTGSRFDGPGGGFPGSGGGGGGGGSGPGGGSGGGGGGSSFTQMLLERLGVPEVRATVASTVERLGRLTQTLEGEEREAAEARLRDLLATLPPEALGMLLDIDLGRRDTMGNLLPAVDWLPAMALVEIVESAARSQKKEISGVLLRLLQKLARQGHHGSGASARPLGDRDLRLVVKGLLEDWSLTDPNTKSHAHILEVLARHDIVTTADAAPADESIRIIQMGIEVDSSGDHVQEAVELAVATGDTDELVGLLQGVEFTPVTFAVWRQLASPAQLRRILADERVSEESVLAILDHVGTESTQILVDRLFAGSQGDVRPRIAERLLRMGPAATVALRDRIASASAEDRSRLLSLLAELPELPDWFDVTRYLAAEEANVRAAAYALAMRRPEMRDEALHAALADADEQVVRVAIRHGLEHFPRSAVPRVMLLLNHARRTVGLRAEAVRILAQFDEPAIRDWLLSGLIARRRWWQLRRRLVPRDLVMLEKLRILQARWSGHAGVDRILQLARQSTDAEVVIAASPERNG